MDQQGKAQIQAVGAGLLGFGLVVGLGSYFVVPHGLSAPASMAARGSAPLFAPVPTRSVDAGAPAAGVADSAAAPASSPAPLLSDEFRPDPAPAAAIAAANSATGSAASAPTSVAAANGSASAAPRLIATAPLGISASGAQSGAASTPAGKTAAPSAASASAAPAAKSAGAASRGVVAAAVVHYGVSDRAQLMERGAGPVYNFGALGEKGDPIAGAVRQVDAAQRQFNGVSGASDSDKAAIQQDVDQVHEVAYQADQAVQQATVQAGAPSR